MLGFNQRPGGLQCNEDIFASGRKPWINPVPRGGAAVESGSAITMQRGKMMESTLRLLSVVGLLAGSCLPLAGAEPEVVSVTKIWDRAPHNAFTDLVRFRDRWFCTFREADYHGNRPTREVMPRREVRQARSGPGHCFQGWRALGIGGPVERKRCGPARSQAFGHGGRPLDAAGRRVYR